MTVKELIKELKEYDENLEIAVFSGWGVPDEADSVWYDEDINSLVIGP